MVVVDGSIPAAWWPEPGKYRSRGELGRQGRLGGGGFGSDASWRREHWTAQTISQALATAREHLARSLLK
nr:unnamed protein product [Digitaria exilis]